jgi:tRNA-splicing ligase RtcB
VVNRELESARYQLGTLGGGNHFIEVQKDNDNTIWFMVHSGSRNFGYKIAREYHNQAKRICEKKKINLPDKQLSFLELSTAVSDDYLAAMNFALSFAAANRSEMVKQIKEVFSAFFPGIRYIREINIHHNYVAFEEHFGKMVLVHRKGATSAKKDEPGIIPGSQGTKSFIVIGKGNQESFSSCSHGAGRRMGRKQAVRELDFKFEKKKLEEKGIIHSLYGLKDLEEASGAYKNIDDVMKQQRDLVEIDTELEPLGVIKG